MSMRKLQFHEQKLLKKVDFLRWKGDDVAREAAILRRYHIENREEYIHYAKLAAHVQGLVHKISKLDAADPFRIKTTDMLLNKLFTMGLINEQNSLLLADKITASSFCRRRLPVVLCRLKMADNIRTAMTMVQHGHVRVGPNCVTDPAFLVNRSMEDFVTWTDGSKYKKTIAKYAGQKDDYDF